TGGRYPASTLPGRSDRAASCSMGTATIWGGRSYRAASPADRPRKLPRASRGRRWPQRHTRSAPRCRAGIADDPQPVRDGSAGKERLDGLAILLDLGAHALGIEVGCEDAGVEQLLLHALVGQQL